jgi:hypothetical protein
MTRVASLHAFCQRFDYHFGFGISHVELSPDELPTIERERRLEGLGT